MSDSEETAVAGLELQRFERNRANSGDNKLVGFSDNNEVATRMNNDAHARTALEESNPHAPRLKWLSHTQALTVHPTSFDSELRKE